MIGIIDYGMGNLLSVHSAFDYLGTDLTICSQPEHLNKVNKIVIPGVGAFKDCINKLYNTGFVDALNEHVLKKGKPTLGICLGMQVMAQKSNEGGSFEGLGWFDSEVIKLHPESNSNSHKVPNIGWEDIDITQEIFLFKKLPKRPDFYFVHSYYMNCNIIENVVATYNYGHQVTAAVIKDNIVATQFHPEKSQDHGLIVLENFINWNP